MALICTNCGESLPESTRFCTSCGSKIESAPPVGQIDHSVGQHRHTEIPVIIGKAVHDESELSSDGNSRGDGTLSSNNVNYYNGESCDDPNTNDLIRNRQNAAVLRSPLRTITRTTLTVLLSIVSFAFILAFVCVLILSPENTQSIVSNAEVNQILSDIDTAIPYFAFTYRSLIVIGALLVLLLFDILLLHRKKIRSAFLSIGILFTVTGLLLTSMSLFTGIFTGFFSRTGYYGYMKLAAGFISFFLYPGLIILGAGILLIAIYALINAVGRNRPPVEIPESTVKTGRKVWRITGLVTNVSVLLLIALFSAFSYITIP